MSNVMDRLHACMENGSVDRTLLPDLAEEIEGLRKRVNELEELLIMIVRTGWAWDAEGEPNAIFHTSKDGFATAMAEARELLGLGHRSAITRTEPRT